MLGRLGVEAALVDGVLVAGDVEIADGRITAFGLAGKRGRGFAVPGFVDLQVNAFGGVDFLDADAAGYRRAGDALLETGVTAYLPTLITSPEEQVLAAMREVPVDDASRPRILGMHLEGPFLSPNRLGTHEASSRRDPDLSLLERLLDAGPVRLMTLAPELAGAGALIDVLLARGIVGAALARDEVYVSVIIDDIHLAPETARTVWKAARERTVLVTDAIAAAPRGDGPSTLGELALQVHEGAVRGPDGVLAGSVLTMIEAVRNLHELGAPIEDAVGAATRAPAGLLGDPQLGRIDIGLPADVVVLNDRIEIERVVVAGVDQVVA